MNAVIDFYKQQAQSRRATVPWLATMQAQALDKLQHQGFPTRHDEDWKYTSVAQLLNQYFAQASHNEQALTPDLFQSGHVFRIHNGQAISNETLPSGVLVIPLAQALQTHTDLIKPHLGRIVQQEHGFHYMNTAMLHNGYFIYIPKGVALLHPIILSHTQQGSDQAVYLRHLVVAEAQSKATIMEEFYGEDQCCYMTNVITELLVSAGATVTHCKLQREGDLAYHLGHLAVKQLQASQFTSHSFNLGAQLARSDTSIDLEQEQARCLMNGLYLPRNRQHIDHHTTVHHLAPHCQSEQDYKGVLMGDSRAVFNGKIKVLPGAHGTNATQQNKNLLISQQAEINTKPQLEIFDHDVVCAHGATVGHLDEEALFYLTTRGLAHTKARDYLVHAFLQNNLKCEALPGLAEFMAQLLKEQLDA